MALNAANFHIGAGSLTVGGTDIGGTTPDGVVITYTPDIHEHMSGQFGNTPIKMTLIGQSVELQVTMGETTAANLAKAIPGASLSGSRLNIGGNAGTGLTGVPLVFTPFDGTSAWYFRNAVVTSPVEVAYQVDNERVYQVTFKAIVNTAHSGSELAYVS
jgi:hypothetical protein